ncbi:MAG: AMP-binding protein [Bacteroidetes bacterium]|nr:AMP-binding protein [Bacteroidota bacterium]
MAGSIGRESQGRHFRWSSPSAPACANFLGSRYSYLEGYGLTKPVRSSLLNTLKPGGLKFGTVGKAIEKVTVRIAEDGEILCKGPNVMLGYYKRPDLTAEMIDEEGWLHTGDIGEMVDGVYLKITDRKKRFSKLQVENTSFLRS